MVHFTIKEIRLHRLNVPLKQPFTTHLQSVEVRESILVEMIDETGEVGLGECVAFSSPWYTEETIQTCWDALESWLIPALLQVEVKNPASVYEKLQFVKGNRMAKAALDLAVWDLFAKKQSLPLWRLLGGVRQEIDAGIVLPGVIDEKMYARVEEALAVGYKRVKFKIDGMTDVSRLEKLVKAYPSMYFFADGNGIFTKLGLEALRAFDRVGLTLIEQPFGEEDWTSHQQASQMMKTPLALDESIRSVDDAKRMIETQAARIIVLKPGRVGGLSEALMIHALAVQHDIPVWIGGMIELGVSKAHNLALASLAKMIYPGDFSSSTHFWEKDIIKPFIDVQKGQIKLTEAPGIGYQLDKEQLKKYQPITRIFT